MEGRKEGTRNKVSRKKIETFLRGKNVWEERILQEPHSKKSPAVEKNGVGQR